MQKAFSLKRQHDILKTPLESKIVGCLASLCVIIYLVSISLALTSEKDSNNLLTVSIVFVSLSLLLTVWLSFYNFCRKDRKYISLDEFFTLKMDSLLDDVNSNMQKGVYTRYLKWKYNSAERSIEIHITNSKSFSQKYNNANGDEDAYSHSQGNQESKSISKAEDTNSFEGSLNSENSKHKRSKTHNYKSGSRKEVLGENDSVRQLNPKEKQENTKKIKQRAISKDLYKTQGLPKQIETESQELKDISFSITGNQKPVNLNEDF